MPTDKENKQGAVELDPETAEIIDSVNAHLDDMDLFTLLDVDLNVSALDLRRAYFRRSRFFHPDRYFTRNLGEYKAMLERIFAMVSASYNFLKDDRRRAAYRREVLNSRDRPGSWTTSGGHIVAVRTAIGLKFIVKDEESFFGSRNVDSPTPETSSEPDTGARQVVLPQKRYALPRLKSSATLPDTRHGDRPDEK
ncbi:MAG: J domain-containing protein [Deltaproteobacteria bacterium]|nr:J domain-containing protein [Deltaproteobacteria bacterium]